MIRHRAGILGVMLLALAGSAAWADLVPNQNFSDLENGALASWHIGETKTPTPVTETPYITSRNVKVSWEKSEAGKPCLKLQGTGSGQDFALVYSPLLRAMPGYEYEMKVRYRAAGLMPENTERTMYASLQFDVFFESGKGRVGAARIQSYKNTDQWAWLSKRVTVPAEAGFVQARLQLVNKFPNAQSTVWVDAVEIEPVDPALPNASFEVEPTHAPSNWTTFGSAKCEWTKAAAHSGQYVLAVSDAPDGPVSGWSTEFPVRADRAYSVTGFIKGGDVLNPNGFVPGGVLALQFLDGQGQPVGKPVISQAVTAKTDWMQVATPKAQPPAQAVTARIVAGLQYANGTAYFDDLSLAIETAAAAEVVRVHRDAAGPTATVVYAKNLLANGDVEAGADSKPAGWTYVGQSAPDWKPEDIEKLHYNGRPDFAVGRGQGDWSHEITYSGKGALLNISIDPPLSKKNQWYGRNPVDGYWISDPMPVAAGRAYMAAGWIRPGKTIESPWFGPLELRFYDAAGKQVPTERPVRSGIGGADPGEWIFWGTMPSVAPAKAVTMRLRFGQEFCSATGGWGRTYADNLAVWELPSGAPLPNYDLTALQTERYRVWFTQATAEVKPPYIPAPADALEYQSAWGRMVNSAPGNLYEDPKAKTKVTFQLVNLLGESRTLRMQVQRFDAWGHADAPLEIENLKVGGGSTVMAEAELPPTDQYGAFYVQAQVLEGKAKVGTASGRYAVMPPLKRPHTVENRLGVTLLVDEFGPYQDELAKMLKTAGFGVAWHRIFYKSLDEETIRRELDDTLKVIDFYEKLGIRTVVQLGPPQQKTVNPEEYRQAGRLIGQALKGRAAAVGNWGIEQANTHSYYRPHMTDDDYDRIVAAQYDGIKSVAPELPVLIGNIATDADAKTIERMYKKPAAGKFDGAILNAYMGLVTVTRNSLSRFDSHGDTHKDIWLEEQAEQGSPSGGDGRRYGEVEGAGNMVRTWMTILGKFPVRVRSVTMWGFAAKGNENGDIGMMTPELQPRPQFVAHAVMSDALADAKFVADRLDESTSLYEWNRGDGALMVAWTNAGQRDVTLEAPQGSLTVMDIMGNHKTVQATEGVVTLHLTTTPIYLFGGGSLAVSTRLEARLEHAQTHPGKPTVRLVLKNNTQSEMAGMIDWQKPLVGSVSQFRLKPGVATVYEAAVTGDLPNGQRTSLQARIQLASGAVYGATASLNFATAAHAAKAPALDGTWQDWTGAQAIDFGEGSQVVRGTIPDDEYRGPGDIRGKMRLMWDAKNLYLGLEALDDKFVAVPERGRQGFMGDSLEFGVQPANAMSVTAPYWEYEIYLPGDGQNHYAASRRMPLPAMDVTSWQVTIKPTGTKGNVNYQVAIPWVDLGLKEVKPGQTISLAIVLNDADIPGRFGGGRKRVRWFNGVDSAKNPQGFGDVTLIDDK